MDVSNLPVELVYRIMELAVEGLPPSLAVRSDILRKFSLVQQTWREPAQTLLESKVQLASYTTAKMYMERPRRLQRDVILDELEVLFDFNPDDDDFYPLTESILKEFLSREITVRSLHLRSSLFMNAFDTSLFLLPAFKELRNLRLDMPIEPPTGITTLPFSLSRLSISEMMDQPLELFRVLLSNSQQSLRSLHVFVIKGGSPLHQRVLTVLPDLCENLRHLSIAAPAGRVPPTLLHLMATCRNLSTFSLTGIDFLSAGEFAGMLSSRLDAFEFSMDPKFPCDENDRFEGTFDYLLRLPQLKNAREVSIVQRLNPKGRKRPSRVEMFRGQQMCKCVFERTKRKAFLRLPIIALDLELTSPGLVRSSNIAERALP
ncbi:hypothetical protein JCM16303_002279 [Sporobolomyces ruberrimus]